ncbi:MAG: hypothetical protein ACFB9M_18910 [Myxococcota bacterium]
MTSLVGCADSFETPGPGGFQILVQPLNVVTRAVSSPDPSGTVFVGGGTSVPTLLALDPSLELFGIPLPGTITDGLSAVATNAEGDVVVGTLSGQVWRILPDVVLLADEDAPVVDIVSDGSIGWVYATEQALAWLPVPSVPDVQRVPQEDLTAVDIVDLGPEAPSRVVAVGPVVAVGTLETPFQVEATRLSPPGSDGLSVPSGRVLAPFAGGLHVVTGQRMEVAQIPSSGAAVIAESAEGDVWLADEGTIGQWRGSDRFEELVNPVDFPALEGIRFLDAATRDDSLTVVGSSGETGVIVLVLPD